MFLQSNHFLTSSVRSSEKKNTFPPLSVTIRAPFSLPLIHLSSPLHHYRDYKGKRKRAHFNQTNYTRKNFSLILSLCLALCSRQDIKILVMGLELGADKLLCRGKKEKRQDRRRMEGRGEGRRGQHTTGEDRWEKRKGGSNWKRGDRFKTEKAFECRVGWSVSRCCSQSHSSPVLVASGAYRSVSALRWRRQLVIRSYQGIRFFVSALKLVQLIDFSCESVYECVERERERETLSSGRTTRTKTPTSKRQYIVCVRFRKNLNI